MSLNPIKTLSALSLAAIVGVTGYVPVAQAFGFGDMMNPSRWMGGGNRDRYNDDYGDYGPYGGGPYGGGPWGGGGPYGGGPYGAPYGGGYGMPGYGAPGLMAPPLAAPAPAAPAQQSSGSSSEVDALKRRIEELEASQKKGQAAPSADWPSAPAFRPMNQY